MPVCAGSTKHFTDTRKISGILALLRHLWHMRKKWDLYVYLWWHTQGRLGKGLLICECGV
jgi:hypothetical protein